MLDKTPIFINQDKRNKHFHSLNMDEVDVLRWSENLWSLPQDFDRIFLKIQRLISYSTHKNLNEKSKLEEDTNNLLRKFVNYIKWKALSRKAKDEQRAFFDDLCRFINFFDWDSYFSRVHNSIAKTTLREYSEKTLWEQFFQTSYWREWNDWMPEGWSCSYWTILLYNFFNKLKEAWLDLEIKLFRYKNLDDKIVNFPSMRHSWLIVTFQGEDYFVDHDGIQLGGNNEPIARKVQPYIALAKEKLKDETVADFFDNFRHENMKETDKVLFFDNVNDFISHVEEYPEYQRISFYRKNWDWEKLERLDYEFIKNWIRIAINGQRHIFYLWDNNISKNGFPGNIINKITLNKDESWVHPSTKEDRKLFKEYFDLVSDKINIEWLYNHFASWWKRTSELVDFFWENQVIMMQQ